MMRKRLRREIGATFKEQQGSWWITLPYGSTKTDASEHRQVLDYLKPWTATLPVGRRPLSD
jgi:hypothetical protein